MQCSSFHEVVKKCYKNLKILLLVYGFGEIRNNLFKPYTCHECLRSWNVSFINIEGYIYIFIWSLVNCYQKNNKSTRVMIVMNKSHVYNLYRDYFNLFYMISLDDVFSYVRPRSIF